MRKKARTSKTKRKVKREVNRHADEALDYGKDADNANNPEARHAEHVSRERERHAREHEEMTAFLERLSTPRPDDDANRKM